MTFRIRYRAKGTHVHCRLFVAQARDRTFALCSEFCLKPVELAALAISVAIRAPSCSARGSARFVRGMGCGERGLT
jgi:hypothetical protein